MTEAPSGLPESWSDDVLMERLEEALRPAPVAPPPASVAALRRAVERSVQPSRGFKRLAAWARRLPRAGAATAVLGGVLIGGTGVSLAAGGSVPGPVGATLHDLGIPLPSSPAHHHLTPTTQVAAGPPTRIPTGRPPLSVRLPAPHQASMALPPSPPTSVPPPSSPPPAEHQVSFGGASPRPWAPEAGPRPGQPTARTAPSTAPAHWTAPSPTYPYYSWSGRPSTSSPSSLTSGSRSSPYGWAPTAGGAGTGSSPTTRAGSWYSGRSWGYTSPSSSYGRTGW